MNIRTIRATANNIITALEIASQQSVRVMEYEIEHYKDTKEAHKTADRMNKEIDGAVTILCTLYITTVGGDVMKYNDELEAQIKKVNDLRVNVWDAIDLINDIKLLKRLRMEGIA